MPVHDHHPAYLHRSHHWGLTTRSIIPALLLIAICLFTPFAHAELSASDRSAIQRYLQYIQPEWETAHRALRYGDPGHSDGLHMYCLLQNGTPTLHLSFYLQNFGTNNWSEFKSCTIQADYNMRAFPLPLVIKDADANLVWEMADREVAEADLPFLRALALSRNTAIIFHGAQSRYIQVPNWQREHIRVMLNLYDYFRELQPTP